MPHTEDGNPIPHRFITIDPGLQASGVALWFSGALADVKLVRCPKGSKGIQDRVEMQAASVLALASSWHSLFPLNGAEKILVVCERMFHRHYRGNRVDPNDLINLNLLSGRLGTHYILPSEWKGSVPREVEQDHSRYALLPCELAKVDSVKPASLRKEVWSAVGIGLSILGRAHQKCGWRFS